MTKYPGILFSILTLSACSSHPLRGVKPVDDSLLSELDQPQMDAIRMARTERDNALDLLAKANNDRTKRESDLALAKSELNAVRAIVKDATIAVQMAEDEGTYSELDVAKRKLEIANARHEAQRKKITWRERETDHAVARVELATAEAEKEKANLEALKAQSVQSIDRPKVKQIQVIDYDLWVSYWDWKVKKARQEVERLSSLLQESEASYVQATAAVAALDGSSSVPSTSSEVD